MEFNIDKLKNLPRKSSKDYFELMHLALENNDKVWFEELAEEKEKIEKLEKEIKFELGWKGND